MYLENLFNIMDGEQIFNFVMDMLVMLQIYHSSLILFLGDFGILLLLRRDYLKI
jgi:hypothetical protein